MDGASKSSLLGAAVVSMTSIGLMAPSVGAAPKIPKGAFTETVHSVPDGLASEEYLAKVTTSQVGEGAGVEQAHVVTDAPSGTVTAVTYFANGSIKTSSTLVFGPSGLSTGAPQPTSGSGKCEGGTGVFAKVKCSYTYTGSFNEVKGTGTITIKGTYKE